MATRTCIEQLESVLRAAEVLRPWSWSWFWEREVTIPRALRKTLPPDVTRVHLVHMLTQRLYSHFYCTGIPVPVQARTFATSPAASKAAFVAALSAANRGTGYLEEGWKVTGRRGRALTIQGYGLRFHVDPDECSIPGEGDCAVRADAHVTAGAMVSRRMPGELRFLSPGFLMVMGEELLAPADHAARVRFYWNLRPAGAAELVALITKIFNQSRLPFRLKVLDDPANYTRCDAAVLYTAKRDYAAVRAALESTYREVAAYLGPEVPAFTKPLADGLGVAEDPAHGESFGQRQCGVLAEGMVRAFEERKTSFKDRVTTARDCFEENGINPERPFLNAGSENVYDFDCAAATMGARTAGGRADGRRANGGGADRGALLRTACEIGELVAVNAIWHGDRCNWLGVGLPRDAGSHYDRSRLTYRTLSPDLYGGTSGVALFLAELYVAAGDAAVRRAALGAIRQAVSGTRRAPRQSGRGLYDGALGVALAAAYVGRLLREEGLLHDAGELTRHALDNSPADQHHDLVSGNAGAILALLILADLLEDDAPAGFAARLGDELLENAQCEEDRCSWKSAVFPKQRNLVGFSHGTAGIACALVELFGAMRDERYLDAARAAFRYERYWFRPDAKNWPDLRGVPARSRAKDHLLDLPVFWCHGAAGIALSRLRANAILQDDALRSEALIALGTTRRWTEMMLRRGRCNFSLCHGLAGNADILAIGSRMAGDTFSGGRDVAMEVAEHGIHRHAQHRHQWPLDWVGSRSPSLMLGLGGIGYFYLRLHDPEVPAILLPDREAIVRRASHAASDVTK